MRNAEFATFFPHFSKAFCGETALETESVLEEGEGRRGDTAMGQLDQWREWRRWLTWKHKSVGFFLMEFNGNQMGFQRDLNGFNGMIIHLIIDLMGYTDGF